MLEYVLLISVVVLVGLGAVYQLNSAFGAYAQDYFGNYLSCLLETGEVPSLGTATTLGGECDAQFEEFSLSRGRPLIDSSGDGGGGSQSSGSQSSPGRRSFGSRRSPSVQSSGGGTPNGERGSSGNGRPSAQLGGGASGGTRKRTKSQGSSSGAGPRLSRRETQARGGVPSSFLLNPERKAAAAVRTVALKKSSIGDLGLRKAILKRSLEKPKPPQEFTLEAGWGFSTYIRYFMIAGILIALGVLLGGQLMQLRKNWEKAE